jgi:hypothetical protein
VSDIDAVEQHGELGGVELRAKRAVVHDGLSEPALLEPLVVEDEATVVPR